MRDSFTEIPEGELSSDNEDVLASAPTTGATNERELAMTPRSGESTRRKTTPTSQRQASITLGGVSVSNHGSGTVTTENSGNSNGAIISNVGNNNSENYFGSTGRPKKGKKPTMTPRQNLRRGHTAPPLLGGVDVNNYGPGNVVSRNVGMAENPTISNVDNDNSKDYYPSRYRPNPKSDGYNR